MIASVCVDDRGGMLFGRRRVSQDRAQRADLLARCAGRRLWVNGYSAPLFGEDDGISVDEAFLTKAEAGEVCFVENQPLRPVLERLEGLMVYRWNRAYPASVYLDIDPLAEGFSLAESGEFSGTSHKKITWELYERRERHG